LDGTNGDIAIDHYHRYEVFILHADSDMRFLVFYSRKLYGEVFL